MFFLGFSISAPFRLGVIDVGSNSTHLYLVEVSVDGVVHEIAHDREQLRLTELKNADGMLGTEALNKLSTILKNMRLHAATVGAPVRAVGTFALRDANNWPEFCERVRKRSDVDIEVVSGIEEARLIHLGVTQTVELRERVVLVLDVGGGSAEIVVGVGSEILFSVSLKLGAVRLTRRFLKSDPLVKEELRNLQEYVYERLLPFCAQVRSAGFEVAVASGGTAKVLAALAAAQKNGSSWDKFRGGELSAEDTVSVLAALIGASSVQERLALPGMDIKRADVVVAGAVVLDAVTRMVGVRQWTISAAGVRDGILIDTVARDQLWKSGSSDDVRWKSVRALGARLGVNLGHGWHVAQLALSLFDGLLPLHSLGREWREYMRAASLLHEAGMFIDFTSYHKHSYYMIHHTPLAGFSLRERDVLAAIIRFHRKRVPLGTEEELRDLRENERQAVNQLSAILRLAVTLDRTRQGLVYQVEVVVCQGKVCQLWVSRRADADVEIHAIEAEKKHLETAFGVKVVLQEKPQ